MSETKAFVKRIREMSQAEINQLPRIKAKLVKTTFKKSDQVNFLLKIELAKDYTEEIRLTEEQYALIKLQRDIAYDKQELIVYGRISKGIKNDGNVFMMLEIVAAKGVYFNVMLSNLRVQQVQILAQRGAWDPNLPLGDYPDAIEDIKDINLGQ